MKSSVLHNEIDCEELGLTGTFFHTKDDELPVGTKRGNWGRKLAQGAVFVRRGKLAAWSPNREDWEIEERARKRIKRMLPAKPRSPSPLRLPHLRSPSPPVMAPYPPPATQHLSFSSFVLDPAAQHSFRSAMISELERTTCGLVEGETPLRRAIGRLWEVLNDDPDFLSRTVREDTRTATVTKTEDVEGEYTLTEREGSLDSEPLLPITPNLGSNIARVFLPTNDPHQEEFIEKCLAALRDLQEDAREYVERLEEIRDGLGFVRSQKQALWTVIREHAIKEMNGADSV